MKKLALVIAAAVITMSSFANAANVPKVCGKITKFNRATFDYSVSSYSISFDSGKTVSDGNVSAEFLATAMASNITVCFLEIPGQGGVLASASK
jgi:hypothetical protein